MQTDQGFMYSVMQARLGFPLKDIQQQLQRILNSAKFQQSSQLSHFLTFVVEATLEGREAVLKQSTIAIQALNRPPGFDPKADPIVRIEARRLRRALARYYREEGAQDPIFIDIPTGSYIPKFSPNPMLVADDQQSPGDSVESLRPPTITFPSAISTANEVTANTDR